MHETKKRFLEGSLHPANVLMCPHTCVTNLPKPREHKPGNNNNDNNMMATLLYCQLIFVCFCFDSACEIYCSTKRVNNNISHFQVSKTRLQMSTNISCHSTKNKCNQTLGYILHNAFFSLFNLLRVTTEYKMYNFCY